MVTWDWCTCYMIISIPDLCLHPYFVMKCIKHTATKDKSVGNDLNLSAGRDMTCSN